MISSENYKIVGIKSLNNNKFENWFCIKIKGNMCKTKKIKEQPNPLVLHIRDSKCGLDRQSTKEAQHHPLLQAPIEVPDCLYSRGAQSEQHKKGMRICSNNN